MTCKDLERSERKKAGIRSGGRIGQCSQVVKVVITNPIGMKLDLMVLKSVSRRLTEIDLNNPF